MLVPLVDPASAGLLRGSSQRVSPLWIQPVLVPFVDPASVVPLVHPVSGGPLSRSNYQCWSPFVDAAH